MQLNYLSEQSFATASLTYFMLGGLCLATSRLLMVHSWHLLFAVPRGERPTMGCNPTPYDTEAPATCCAAGQKVQLAEAQQTARPQETVGGCPGALYPPTQDAEMLLHAVHSRNECEVGNLDHAANMLNVWQAVDLLLLCCFQHQYAAGWD